MDDDFMDDAFIARMRQLQANPRPTPRKHTYTFHGVKVLCREGDDIPKDLAAWVQEHMRVHLQRCIVHYFQDVRPDRSIEPKKVFQEFLIHQLESTFRDRRPRFQLYTPGERSYAWYFMFCFTNWIHEQYPPTETKPKEETSSFDRGLEIPAIPEEEEYTSSFDRGVEIPLYGEPDEE